ncbi:MAG: c-type cytochrome [Verrucomicrobia bacterium]|nr:c-type cytochrome [Verrucomicrobiota bacterium]
MKSTKLLFLLVLVALSCAVPLALTESTPEQVAKIRADAKTVLAVLPDRMPGAEKDIPQRVELGRKLYFEKKLSMNESQSCNTCHDIEGGKAGVDNEPTSAGAFGKRGDRNSPTVLNAGFHVAQFWDGRAQDLKEQAKGPVLNPVEMAMPDEVEVVRRLNAEAAYPKLFEAAFPESRPAITYDNVAEAIAAFERTLKTDDRLDDFLRGDDRALNGQELQGLALFLETGCTVCHYGPTLGGLVYHKAGLIKPYENTEDLGRYTVTKDEDDKFKFKVPSLRNVALTGPYFHDGRIQTLDLAVVKMADMQLGRQLTAEETALLRAFLGALSDKKLAAQGK